MDRKGIFTQCACILLEREVPLAEIQSRLATVYYCNKNSLFKCYDYSLNVTVAYWLEKTRGLPLVPVTVRPVESPPLMA